MPARSAKGSRSSRASAAASPVIAMVRVFVVTMGLLLRLDGQHGAGRFQQYALGVAAQDEFANRCAAAQADHDEVSAGLLRDRDQVFRRFEPAHQLADLVVDAVTVELRADIVELA